MATWKFIARDYASGSPIGEITNCKARALDFPLNNVTTGSFKVRLDNPLADTLLYNDVVISAYEGTTLRENFDIASAQEVGSGAADDGIAITLTGGYLRLGSGADQPGRLCGKSSSGFQSTGDRGIIAGSLITTTNAEADTGIRVGTIITSATAAVGPWYYKPIGEAIAEMSAALDGYDFQFVPLDPVTNAGKLWEFQAAPYLGLSNNTIVTFEYGVGKHNVKTYQTLVDRKGRLNRAFGLPPNFPPANCDTSPGTVQQAQAAVTPVYGLREAVVDSDIADDSLRQFLCQEHVRVRTQARQVIIFDTVVPDGTGRVPKFKVDYDVGDIITGRAYNPLTKSLRFNATFRIYGVGLTIDDNGIAAPSLRLVPSGSS